jgi:hypothetical protein
MANADELNATLAAIKKNLHLWDQADYFTETECGTVACFDGWTLLRHGYEPRSLSLPGLVAQRILGLTNWEHDNLSLYFTNSVEDLELRVKEIIAGEWANHPDGEAAW